MPKEPKRERATKRMSNNRGTGIPAVEIIRDLEGVAGNLGDWVANGTPSTPVGQAIQTRFRAQCDSYSNAPSWFTSLQTPGQRAVANICDPYLSANSSGPPVNEVPFTGGQCDCARYEVNINIRNTSNNIVSSIRRRRLRGPITGIRFSDTTTEVFMTCKSNIVDDDESYPPCTTLEERFYWNRPPGPWVFEELIIREAPDGDACGDPPGVVGPNPNPRPDPGLDPEDEPFEDPVGTPFFPGPTITNPYGEPVQLPNLPLPNPFATQGEGGAPSNPNVGPPVEPGDEIQGDPTDSGDDDFGDPPEGNIWVGFLVELSDQGVTEGLQIGSPPEPIYRASTGNYRAVYEIEGEKVYSTPMEIRQQSSTYFLDLPGLTLVGARVNVPGNDSYSVTPLYQPVEEEEPQQV